MSNGAQISSAIMFVQQLDRSVGFYTEVLGLEQSDRSATAALLTSQSGAQLILRSMGQNAPHALGGIGVQYVVWTAAGAGDLTRCERVLRERSAHVETRVSAGVSAVEGRDPDGTVVIVVYPGPDQVPLHELPVRIYGW
jgi:catechol 2,3-dioxygenase-like lactoylglutathione lyase family enzyme